MRRRTPALLTAAFVFLSAFSLTITILPGNAKATTLFVGGSGPGNYTTIQSAIDNATPGDIVFVYNGTYPENIVIDRILSIEGEDKNTTIIDGGRNGYVVNVGSSWVNISGFTITRGSTLWDYSGIELDNVDKCSITNNIITDNLDGIRMTESNDTLIANNRIFSNHQYGIWLRSTSGNTIVSNTMVEDGIVISGDSLEHWNTHTIDTSNTVSGKPVRYLKNSTGGIVPLGAGQVILANCTNMVVVNQSVNNGSVGILIGFSSGISIINNTASGNDWAGISLQYSALTRVSENVVSWNYRHGISLYHSDDIRVDNNTLPNNGRGVFVSYSTNNIVRDNIITLSTWAGFLMSDSSDNLIINNTISSSGGNGISVWLSDGNSFLSNTVTSSGGNGIKFESFGMDPGSKPSLIANNTILSNSVTGIYIAIGGAAVDAFHNEVHSNGYGITYVMAGGNVVANNVSGSFKGISMAQSGWSALSDNNIWFNEYGLYFDFPCLFGVPFCGNIANNTVWSNRYGIYAQNSMYLSIHDSHIYNNFDYGIILLNSRLNSINDNNVSENYDGIYLETSDDNTIAHNEVSSNDGEGIFLFESNNNTIYENMATYNIFDGISTMYSGRNRIVNNTVFGNLDGIYLDESSSTLIANNTVMGNFNGIALWYLSDNNLVLNNTVNSNDVDGISLDTSNNNSILLNNVSSNLWDGIYLLDSDGNTIRGNTVSLNSVYGIDLESSRFNRIYHNRILNNVGQAYDDTNVNEWDDGYPSGGNYWSDYTGVDFKYGPNQDQPGSDGIGDTPYFFDFSQDRYPLTDPSGFRPFRPPTVLDATLTGIDAENVTITWSPSPDDGGGQLSVVGYGVYRNTIYDSGGVGYQLIVTLPNGTSSFTDINAGEGDSSNYFYRICAVDMGNNSTCAADQAGKFTRQLSEGPKLVSIPLVQSDESIGTVLQTLHWDKTWTYNSSVNEWKWYMKFKPCRGQLKKVNHLMGLWVNVTQDSNLTVAGLVPSSTNIQLFAGWNLVGLPSFNATYVVADLKAETGATRVEAFDPNTSPYFLKEMQDSDILLAGEGYWVYVPSDVVWVLSNG